MNRCPTEHQKTIYLAAMLTPEVCLLTAVKVSSHSIVGCSMSVGLLTAQDGSRNTSADCRLTWRCGQLLLELTAETALFNKSARATSVV